MLAGQTLDTTFVNALPFARMDLCHSLAPADVVSPQAHALRSTHPAGPVLFEQGEPGDTIYPLAHGSVSMMLRAQRRTAPEARGNVCPGRDVRRVRRAGGAHAYHACVLRSRRRRLDALQCVERIASENPPLAASVYRALSRNVSARLRATTRELRDLADP